MSKLGKWGALAGLAQGLSSANQLAMMQRIQENKDKAVAAQRKSERAEDKALRKSERAEDKAARAESQDKTIAASADRQDKSIKSAEKLAGLRATSNTTAVDDGSAKAQERLDKLKILRGKNQADGIANAELDTVITRLEDEYISNYSAPSASTGKYSGLYTKSESPNTSPPGRDLGQNTLLPAPKSGSIDTEDPYALVGKPYGSSGDQILPPYSR